MQAQRGLDHADDALGRGQLAVVGGHRAGDHAAVAVNPGQAVDLHLVVAGQRAAAQFQITHRRRIRAGLAQGRRRRARHRVRHGLEFGTVAAGVADGQAAHYRVDAVLGVQRRLLALEHHHAAALAHRRVDMAGAATRRPQHVFQAAGEAAAGDDHRVHQLLGQHELRQLYRLEGGVFMRAQGEGRAVQLQVSGDAAGHHIADAAGDALRIRLRKQAVFDDGFQRRGLRLAQRDAAVRQAVSYLPGHFVARLVARAAVVHVAGDDDGDIALAAVQLIAGVVEGALGDGHQEQMRQQMAAHHLGRQLEAFAVEIELLDIGARRGLTVAARAQHVGAPLQTQPAGARQRAEVAAALGHRPQQGVRGFGVGQGHAHADDGQALLLGRQLRPGGRRRVGAVFAQHHVAVDAAETEGVDAGALGLAALRPRRGIAHHVADVQLAAGGADHVFHVQRRRNHAAAHRQQHLENAGHAGGGQHVTDIALVGADQRPLRLIGEEGLHRAQLHLVAHRGAGGVAFQVIDILVHAVVGAFQRQQLAVEVRHQNVLGAAVVGQAYGFDHAVDAVLVAHRVGVALERDHAGALARLQALGIAVERHRLAVGREGLQHVETVIDVDMVGVADRAGQHQIGLAALQVVAGHADGVQRGGASRVQREAGAGQAQRLRRQRGVVAAGHQIEIGQAFRLPGLAEMEIVALQQFLDVGLQDALVEAVEQLLAGMRGHADIADDQAAALQRLGTVSCSLSGVDQRLFRRVERPLEQGVQRLQLRGGQTVAAGVQLEAAHVAVLVVGDLVRGARHRMAIQRRVHAQLFPAQFRGAIPPLQQVAPVLFWRFGAWKQAA